MAVAARFKEQINGLRQKSDLLGTPPELPDRWFAKFLHLSSRKERKDVNDTPAKRSRSDNVATPAQRTDSATATAETANAPVELPGSEAIAHDRHPQQQDGQPIPLDDSLVSSPYGAGQPPRPLAISHDENTSSSQLREVNNSDLESESGINKVQTLENSQGPLMTHVGRYEPPRPAEHASGSSDTVLGMGLGVPMLSDLDYPTLSNSEEPNRTAEKATDPAAPESGLTSVTGLEGSGSLADISVQQSIGSRLRTLAEEDVSDKYVKDRDSNQATQPGAQPAGPTRKYKNPMNPYNRLLKVPSPAHTEQSGRVDAPPKYPEPSKKPVVAPLGSAAKNEALANKADRLSEQSRSEAQLSKTLDEEVKLFNTRVGPYVRSIIRHNVKGLSYGRYVRADLELGEAVAYKHPRRRGSTIIITHSGLTAQQVKDIESLFSKPERIRGLQGFRWAARESNAFGFRGTRRKFSNTAAWGLQTEPTIEIALPRDHRTLCGAPVQVIPDSYLSNPHSASWTCGGLVLVNGAMFCLTTAHPLIIPLEPHDGGDTGDEIEPDPSLWHPWQTAGLVNQFALSHRGDVPDNCDWLLFELAREHQLPNMSTGGKEGKLKGDSWIRLPSHKDDPTPAYASCQIHTSHGVLHATMEPGYSFIITGESAFDTIRLSHPDLKLDKGDSGAWVTHSGELIGILIAADDTTPASAFAIRIEDVIRNISKGMGGASVELPSAVDNEILNHLQSHNDEDPQHLRRLIDLYLTRALQSEDDRRHAIRRLEPFGRHALFPGLAPYIQIGKLVQVPTERVQTTLHKHRYNPLVPLTMGHRTAAKLAKTYHGQCFLSFVAWFLLRCREGMTLDGTIDYLTLLIEGLFQEIEADPTCIPSTNEVWRLISDVAFGWPISLRIYSMFRRSSPRFPLEVAVPKGVPPPHVGARLLVRLLTFDRKRCFFVYQGPYARWLAKFADPFDSFKSDDARTRPVRSVSRVFLTFTEGEEAGYEIYGKTVHYPELEDALQGRLQESLGPGNVEVKGDNEKLGVVRT